MAPKNFKKSGYEQKSDSEEEQQQLPSLPAVPAVESDDEPDPDAAPSGVDNPLFNIHGTTSEEDYMRLREVYDALSLDEQHTVSLLMDEQMEFAKERLAAIKSSKEVEKEIKASKRINKEKVDRSKSNVITLYVKVAGHPEIGQKSIVVNRNGKCGQIRKQVCMVFGVKASGKPTMMCGDANRPNGVAINNMNIFVYTMGIDSNSTIWLIPENMQGQDAGAQQLNAELNNADNPESEEDEEGDDANADEGEDGDDDEEEAEEN